MKPKLQRLMPSGERPVMAGLKPGPPTRPQNRRGTYRIRELVLQGVSAPIRILALIDSVSHLSWHDVVCLNHSVCASVMVHRDKETI
jgi:hypothetical protein